MTNEAELMVETHLAIPFTVANETGIPKGTICTMSDPMTAAATTANGAIVAGIAKKEKIASDGKTKHAIYRGGIFKVVASGSITVGDPLATAEGGTNYVYKAPTNTENILGIALETATDEETFLMELRPTSMSLA